MLSKKWDIQPKVEGSGKALDERTCEAGREGEMKGGLVNRDEKRHSEE